ncbi:2-amino-4-hydroxy-6-hydroxymethyldihydropteridine diphosphokinase [Cellulomonas cellasea]|uniref:Bifunctional folate synthesis protein n=1 Tax=Cellulomonas cellasea TaxID=43670 RepID=A0A4Y3KYY6_9CELL|nr:2-amino-4-hydroxy-6-hydroxymethyldihydropteridine diphosphokinase [Cellulomonas cellasea]GEA88110.1 hypothetical protein CCE01nite_20590 [Cellulomonas cellasea]
MNVHANGEGGRSAREQGAYALSAAVAHDASGRRLDRIRVLGISAIGYHGVFEHERRDGQEFVADVVVHLDTRRAAARDELALTLDYGTLSQHVAGVLSSDPADLIETVAERIAATVLAFPQAVAVDVALHKPRAPIPVPFDDVVVEIYRDRDKLPAAEPWRPAAEDGRERAAVPSAPVRTVTAQLPTVPAAASATAAVPSGPRAAEPVPDPHPPTPHPPTPHPPAPLPPVPTGPHPGAPSPADPTDPLGGRAPFPYDEGPYVPLPYRPEVSAPESYADADETPGTHHSGPVRVDGVAPARHGEAGLPPVPAPELAAHVRSTRPELLAGPAAQDDVVDGELVSDALDEAPRGPVDVVLALGSNLGAAQETLRDAVYDLAEVPGIEVVDVSPLARTAPVGGPDQPDFLNAVVLARTTLSPRDLLRATQAVEQIHGRERHERWGPRTLDVDIVVYGTTLAVTDDLELPHPRAHERAFVLQPWAQVAPDAVLPGLGGGPVAALAATAPDRDGIRWLALDWLTVPVPAVQPEPAGGDPGSGPHP